MLLGVHYKMSNVKEKTAKLLDFINSAQKLGMDIGIKNILQPGIVRELLIANILNHEVIPQKADADAKDKEGNLYEYLSSLNKSNNFQIDRITENNLHRIERNKSIICAFFDSPLEITEMFEVDARLVLQEVKRQISASKNSISHVNLPGNWIRKNGTKVFSIKNKPFAI